MQIICEAMDGCIVVIRQVYISHTIIMVITYNDYSNDRMYGHHI